MATNPDLFLSLFNSTGNWLQSSLCFMFWNIYILLLYLFNSFGRLLKPQKYTFKGLK